MSFQRRSATSALSGVRIGLTPTTPSGIPHLDTVLGGGLPLGSILALAEDEHNVYGRQLMKAFIAEGIVHRQRVLVVDGEVPLKLDELPRRVDKEVARGNRSAIGGNDERYPDPRGPPSSSSASSSSLSAADSMKIAFRYERLPEVESLSEGHVDHVLDFGLPIEPDELQNADIVRCNALTSDPDDVLCKIAASVSKDKVLRVAVGVGLILDHRFLRRLRIIARCENVVCWVSVPACVTDEAFQRLFATADCVLSLVAFSSAERQTNPLYKNFHGLLTLDKLAEINSITTGTRPPTVEYTFHQSGKRFAMEQLHMPPDLATVGSTGPPPPTMSCQTSGGGGKLLDF